MAYRGARWDDDGVIHTPGTIVTYDGQEFEVVFSPHREAPSLVGARPVEVLNGIPRGRVLARGHRKPNLAEIESGYEGGNQ
jgi:hypothetical protein